MNRRASGGTPLERVLKGLDLGDDRCWIWAGYVELNGYGALTNMPKGTSTLVHRVMYEGLVGPIPKGFDLHHRCGEKLCCNPAHLEPMRHDIHASHTRRPNQNKCLSGKHDWIPENLIKRGKGKDGQDHFTCRLCNRERDKAYRLKKRKEAAEHRVAAKP